MRVSSMRVHVFVPHLAGDLLASAFHKGISLVRMPRETGHWCAATQKTSSFFDLSSVVITR